MLAPEQMHPNEKTLNGAVFFGGYPFSAVGNNTVPAPHFLQKQHQLPFETTENQFLHKHEHNYRAERLEKQRQTVVGGSLFVTSPRSFLMGLKK